MYELLVFVSNYLIVPMFPMIQLKAAEHEKQLLQEQLLSAQTEVSSCNREILNLGDKLGRAQKKIMERKRHSLDKLHTSK